MESLLLNLNQMRISRELCDATLIAEGGYKFYAHRVVLAGSSQYFKAMFSNDFKEQSTGIVSLQDVSKQYLSIILTFIYIDQIKLTYSVAFRLFELADRLQIISLGDKCAQFLTLNIDITNCLHLWRLGSEHSSEQLQLFTKHFILNNFDRFRKTEQFYDLSKDEILSLLRSDDLCVQSEKHVMESLLEWIHKQDVNERVRDLEQLLPCIRFPLLDCNYYSDVVLKNDLIKTSCHWPAIRSIYEHEILWTSELKTGHNLDLTNTQNSETIPTVVLPRMPNKVLFLFGGWNKGRTLDTIECINPKTNRCSIKPRFRDPQGGRCYYDIAALDDQIYCAGGYDGKNYLNSVRRFDPVMETWSDVAPMYAKRCFSCLVALDSELYALAGYDGSMRLSSMERYSPVDNQWTMVQPLKTPRSDACAEQLNGRIYVFGGFGGESLRTCEVYDKSSGRWHFIASMECKRSGAASVSINDQQIIVMGGYDGSCRQRSTEVYNIATNKWSEGPDMHFDRSNFAACLLGNSVYVIGGYTGYTTIQYIERLDLLTMEWSRVGKASLPRSAMRVCAIGGFANIREFIREGADDIELSSRLETVRNEAAEYLREPLVQEAPLPGMMRQFPGDVGAGGSHIFPNNSFEDQQRQQQFNNNPINNAMRM